MEGFSDSDWANDKDGRRSINGYVFKICGGAITWKSRKQSSVALSSTEAEYVGYSEAAKEAIWLRKILMEIDMRKPLSEEHQGHHSKWGQQLTGIYVDNHGAVDLASNPKHHDRTKHIDIRHHFIRHAKENGQIDLIRIPTAEQTADILTKPLGCVKFEQHREEMGIIEIKRPSGS